MSPYPIRCLIFIVSLFILLIISPVSAQNEAVGGTWSRPENLGPGWFPAVTVDRTGTAHLAWHRGNVLDAIDLLMYVTRPAHPGSEDPTDVIYTGYGGLTIRTEIDVSNEGLLYAYYRSRNTHELAVAPVSTASNASQWKTLFNSRSEVYYPGLIIDQDNVIHTVSQEFQHNPIPEIWANLSMEALIQQMFCVLCAEIIYRRSTDGGASWSVPQNLSMTINGSDRPDIFQGDSGRLYIYWSEGVEFLTGMGTYQDGRYVYSDDGGLTWSAPVILSGSSTGLAPAQFALTEFNDGSVLGVWRYATNQTHIYYQISQDSGITWTEPAPVPGISTMGLDTSLLDKYALLTDKIGSVHLFAMGYEAVTGLRPALYHVEYRQDRWLRPIRVYYDPNPDVRNPEWPSAAVGPRNDIHLTWFVRSEIPGTRRGSGVGDLQVWYAHRSPTLPETFVQGPYESTPTPEVVAFVPDFEATAVPLPTLAPLDPTLNAANTSDLYAIEVFLAAIGIVVLLCVTVLLLMGYRPRFR